MKIGLLVNSDDLHITFCHLKFVYPHISNLKFGWNIKNEKVALSIHNDIVSFYILFAPHFGELYQGYLFDWNVECAKCPIYVVAIYHHSPQKFKIKNYYDVYNFCTFIQT